MKYQITKAQLEEMVTRIVECHLDVSEAVEYALSVCGEFNCEDTEECPPNGGY